ncbi:carboxypeptidase regulatory-like domain-containing protein [Silvibacterium sp.]|uniref:carboxypeptidase regulatory-like domain-containing protein n=1 Tax=Silvibacterium sp. TaxID=1964179 RepID=UPI0039E4DAF3
MKRTTQQFRQYLLLCLAALFLLIAAPAFAQSTQGELVGTIKDTSGAVIPGAKIIAVGVDTGVSNLATSTSSGAYHFPSLAIGRYTVTVTSPGFATSKSEGVVITINSSTALNVVLNAGGTNETVTVDASAPTIETESSDISGTISQQQITDLPLAVAAGVGGLRSPEAFAFLVPGVTGVGTATDGNTSNGVWYMRVAGGQAYGSETLLDGASIERSENGSSFDETSPSIEALQEFKVTTSIPKAEFGRSTIGIESFATKSGSNSIHGTGFTIVKNAALDANNWFNNGYKQTLCGGDATGCAYDRPADSKYDFGGTLGGPVVIPSPFHPEHALYNGKDKTFFFFAWEQYRLTLGGNAVSTVPTEAERNGDFTALLGAASNVVNPCTGQYVKQNEIFDPATAAGSAGGTPCRQPFATDNVIPSSRFSPAARAMMATLPEPNRPYEATTPQGGTGNYVYNYIQPTENTTYSIRIDEALNEKNKIFGSYSSRDNWRINGDPNMPLPYQNSGYLQDFETHYIRLGWDHTFTPTVLNSLAIGYNRTNSINYAPQIGSTNTLTADGAPNYYSQSFPTVYFDTYDGYSSWGIGNNGDNIDNGLRFSDSVTWQKGRHSFKFGFDWRHQQYSTILKNIPQLNFWRYETDFGTGSSAPTEISGNAFAGFLLGDVDYSAQTVYNHDSRWNSHYVAGYVEDDVKVSSALTLNLGLRYDIDTPRKEADNYTSAFSFTAPDSEAGGLPGALVFGRNCNCNTAWADTWYKDIAPRVGFAYVLPNTNGKAVLRGGGGLIYAPLLYGDFGSAMAQGYTVTRYAYSLATAGNAATAANFTPAFQLDSGYSGFAASNFAPNTSPTQDDAGPGDPQAVAGEVIKPSFGRPGMISTWSLQLQDEVAPDLIFTLGYMGQSGQNLRSGYLSNANNIDTKYFNLGDHLDNQGNYIATSGGSTSANGTTYNSPYSTFLGYLGQSLRPYPQYDYIADDCCLENLGHSSYEAMVTSLERRFRNGVNLQISYTWSKNENDADSAIAWDYVGYRSQSQNSSNLKLEKAVSEQNTPQQLSASYLYQLPFGKDRKFLNHSKLVDYTIGGWEIGGIQRYQSGNPIDFGCGTAAPYYQNCFRFTRGPAAANNDFASAAYKKNKNKPSYFNGQSWFKPAYRPAQQNSTTDAGVSMSDAAFIDENREGYSTYNTGNNQWVRPLSADCATGADQCSYAPYVFGSGIPRVTEAITGPLFKSEDFSLLKTFPIHDKLNFVFKVEAIDAFNRHRMAIPDTEPGDSTGSTGFGIPTAVDYGPRNLQVTGRINF